MAAFSSRAADGEPLITRQKDLYDNAVPSGNSLAAMALLRLGKLTARDDYLAAARRTLEAAAPVMRQAPSASGQMLMALDFQLGPTPEIAIVGDPRGADTAEALSALRGRYIPNRVLACRLAGTPPAESPLARLFKGKTAPAEQPAVYICEHQACGPPRIGKEAAIAAWIDLAGPQSTS